MNAWTNDNTGHNRTIDTGPTLDGKIDNLLITVGYANYSRSEAGNDLWRAIALDGHIIPLILRVPEMRDTLRECADAVRELIELREFDGYSSGEWRELLERIEALTAPTREEAEQGA